MIQSTNYHHGLMRVEACKNKGEKRDRIEEIISSWKESELNQTSTDEANLQNRLSDISKKRKTGDSEERTSETDVVDDLSRDDRSRFNLYFGNPASSGGIFFGTAEQFEVFEQQLMKNKEADIAYHEGLTKLDEQFEDFEGAGENFRTADSLGHPAAKLGRLFIETLLNK